MLGASAEQADRSATTTTSTPTATSPAALMSSDAATAVSPVSAEYGAPPFTPTATSPAALISSDAATAGSPVSAEYGAPPFPGSCKPGQANGDQILWYFAWGGQAGRDAIIAELKGRDCVGLPSRWDYVYGITTKYVVKFEKYYLYDKQTARVAIAPQC